MSPGRETDEFKAICFVSDLKNQSELPEDRGDAGTGLFTSTARLIHFDGSYTRHKRIRLPSSPPGHDLTTETRAHKCRYMA
eukprot:scaffold2224_cov261-Pinguiococcus_pyrenoidosus.AAC.22